MKLILFLAIIAVISVSSASYWSSSIETETSSWKICRQSNNISFFLSGSIEGNVSPIDFHGRILIPYYAHYAEVGTNDVQLRERTSALDGSLGTEDKITLQSSIEDVIHISVIPESNLYAFYFKEKWPVFMTSSRTIKYSGKQINDGDLQSNNGDFVSGEFLYNQKFFKKMSSSMWVPRMNATVLATDEAILQAEFNPTKYLGYQLNVNSTGIADLCYNLRGSSYDTKRNSYPSLMNSDERYYGTYVLARNIKIKSPYEITEREDSWLPCCYEGLDDLKYADQKSIGTNAKGIFDCTSCKEATKE